MRNVAATGTMLAFIGALMPMRSGATAGIIQPANPATMLPHPSQYILEPLLSYNGTGDKYTSAAKADDGRLFCAPHQAINVLVIEPQNNSTREIPTGLQQHHSPQYSTIVKGKDGRMYAPPAKAEHILVVDPGYNTTYTLPLPTPTPTTKIISNTGQYVTATLLPDGRIVAVPFDAADVLVIDPSRNDSAHIGGSTTYNFFASVLGDDGRVYAPPYSRDQTLVVDPFLNTTYYLDSEIGVACYRGYFRSLTKALDGRIFSAPSTSDCFWIHVIDPSQNRSYLLNDVLQTSKTFHTLSFGYSTSALAPAPDGRIFAIPRNAERVLVINPSTNTTLYMSAVYNQGEMYTSSVVAQDGRIFAMADGSADQIGTLVIEPGTNSSWQMDRIVSDSNAYKASILADDGRIFGIPATTDKILVIDIVAQPNLYYLSTDQAYKIGPNMTGNMLYVGSAVGAGNRVVAPPYNADDVLIIDPEKGVYTLSSHASGSGNGKYYTAAAADDGRVFAPPFNYLAATKVLVVDPSLNTSYLLQDSFPTDYEPMYRACAKASDGRIYAAPDTADAILVIDPTTNSTTSMGNFFSPSGSPFKFVSIVPSLDLDLLLMIPGNYDKATVIDPQDGNWYTIGPMMSGEMYSTACRANDGRLFAIPYVASIVWAIDLSQNSTYSIGSTLGGNNYRYKTCQKALDGRIFSPPYSGKAVLVINPMLNSSYQLAQAYNPPEMYVSSVLHTSSGLIYSPPFGTQATYVMVIDPSSNTSYYLISNPSVGSDPNKYETIALAGSYLYAVPSGGVRVLVIRPNYTMSPSTLAPVTTIATLAPATPVQILTMNPTTDSPTTTSPQSSIPTLSPMTENPTPNPVTISPTLNPATATPTLNPTTLNPTTVNPSMAAPTTVSPATSAPSITITAQISLPDVISPALSTHIDALLSATGSVNVLRCIWNVTRVVDNAAVPLSTGKTDFSLSIPAGTLLPGVSYSFQFEAHWGIGQTAVATAIRSTSVSSVYAVIAGGSSRTVSASEPLVINASASYDPDRALGGVRQFTWECRWRQNGAAVWQSSVCGVLPGGGGLFEPALSFAPSALSSNREYEFNVTFGVNISSNVIQIFRTASASTLVKVVPGPVPTCQVALVESNSGRVPYGLPIRLLASAMPHPNSSTSRFALRYSWNASAPHSAIMQSAASVSGASLDIPFSALLTSNTVFDFTVVVFDDDVPSQAAATIRVTTGIEPFVSLKVSPTLGFALQTSFGYNVTAVGEQPLRYTFSYSLIIGSKQRIIFLIADSYEPGLNASLPAGEPVTARVEVKGALGSVASAAFNVTVTDPPIVTGSVVVCTQVRALADRVRVVLEQDGVVDPSRYGICSGIDTGIQALIDVGRFADATRSILNIQTSIDRMQANLTSASIVQDARTMDVTACNDPPTQVKALYGSDGHSCGSDTGGTLTSQQLAGRIWSMLVQLMLRTSAMQSSLEQTSLPAIVATAELTTSPSANLSADSINNLALGTSRIVNSIEPSDLAGSAGNEAISVVSVLVEAASRGVEQNASGSESGGGVPAPGPAPGVKADPSLCDALSSALGVADALLLRAGVGLVPGSEPLSFSTSVLESRAQTSFADTASALDLPGSAGTNASQKASIILPPSRDPDSGDLDRGTRVLALAQWSGLSAGCRSGSASSTLSKMYSVTLEDGGARVTTFAGSKAMSLTLESDGGIVSFSDDGAICAYWNVASRDWSSDGCALSSIDAATGQYVCNCTHLTDFAVIQRQQEAGESDDLPIIAQTVYQTFAALFSAECALAGVLVGFFVCSSAEPSTKKSKRDGRVRTLRMLSMVIFVAALRVVGCILFGQLAGGAASASSAPAAVFVISAGTYICSFFLLSQLLYQWVVLIKSTETLSGNTFQAYWRSYLVSICILVVTTVVSFVAVATIETRAVRLVASLAVAAVCLAVGAGLFYSGIKFHNMSGVAQKGRTSRVLGRLRLTAFIACACFGTQSVAWVVSAAVGDSMSDSTLYGLTAVILLADVVALGAIIFLYGAACVDSTRKSRSSVSASYRKRTGRGSRVSRSHTGHGSKLAVVEMVDVAKASSGTTNARSNTRLSAREQALAVFNKEYKAAVSGNSGGRSSVEKTFDQPSSLWQSRVGSTVQELSGLSAGQPRNSSRMHTIDAFLSPSGGVGQAFLTDAAEAKLDDSLTRDIGVRRQRSITPSPTFVGSSTDDRSTSPSVSGRSQRNSVLSSLESSPEEARRPRRHGSGYQSSRDRFIV